MLSSPWPSIGRILADLPFNYDLPIFETVFIRGYFDNNRLYRLFVDGSVDRTREARPKSHGFQSLLARLTHHVINWFLKINLLLGSDGLPYISFRVAGKYSYSLKNQLYLKLYANSISKKVNSWRPTILHSINMSFVFIAVSKSWLLLQNLLTFYMEIDIHMNSYFSNETVNHYH